jgi:hypothetical protein
MEDSTKPLSQKKEYHHPVLTDHGTLARLTQAGSGVITEGMHSSNVKRKP